MSESTVVEGQEPNATTPQADPATTQPKDPESKDTKPTAPATYSEEYVKDLRKESAGYRTKLADTQKQLDTVLTKLNAIETEQKATKTKAAFDTAATEAGAIYLDPIYVLVADKITVDDAGVPDAESLKTVLEDTKKAYPALFKSTTPARGTQSHLGGKQVDAGATSGDAPAPDFNTWIRQNL